MPYIDDNDPGNSPIGDPTLDQPMGPLDHIKKYLGGMLPKEKTYAPPVDMARWGPVLEAADLKPDSAQYKLLSAISGHLNSAPIPREDSPGSKALGIGLNAIGAGFLARARDPNPQAPTQGMIADWQHRRDMADNGRMEAWKTAGSTMIPAVQNTVQSAELRKQAQEALERGYAGIYGRKGPAASPGGSPEGGSPSAATTPAGPAAAAPGASQAGPAGPPADAPHMAPGVTRQEPGRSADDPQYPLDGRGTTQGNSPIRFHLPDSALQADVLVRRALEENAARVGSVKRQGGSDEEALKQEANTPGSVLAKAIADDRAAWQALPKTKARASEAEEYSKGRVAASMEAEKKIDSGAEAGQNANRTLDLMRKAFAETQKSGVLGPGFATHWLTNINNALDRVGLPHMETAPIQMINELSNRMGMESMMEEMAAGNGMRGGGQQMFKAFRAAVANTDQNPSGFAAIMEAMQALNDMHAVRQTAKNQYKAMMEESGQTPIIDYKAQQYINGQAKAAFDRATTAVDAVLKNGAGASPSAEGGAKQAAAPPLTKEQNRDAVAKIIAESGGKLSVPEAMDLLEKQRGGGTTQPAGAEAAPAATSGVPPPPPEGTFKRKLWNWSYPDEAQRAEQLDRVRRLGGVGGIGSR